MRPHSLLLVVVLAFAAWAGLPATRTAAHTGIVTARLELEAPAVAGQPATVVVSMADSFEFPVIGAAVQARAEGPGRARSARLQERSEGVYAAQMTFPEAGDWQILVDVEFPDGEFARGTLPLRVLAPGEAGGRPQTPRVTLQAYTPTPWRSIGIQAAASAAVLAALVGVVEWIRRRKGG